MSIHTECGAEIRWALRSDDPDRFNPPLEFNGFGYIITESGQAIEVVTYKVHVCDATVMGAFQENLREVERLRGEKPQKHRYPVAPATPDEWENIRKARELEDWKLALTVDCRKCEAPAKKKCINLTKKDGTLTQQPHAERLKDATQGL